LLGGEVSSIEKISIIGILFSAISLMSAIIIYLVKSLHKQAMDKLDKVIDSNSELGRKVFAHTEKLEAGSKEFYRIEEHQKFQDELIYAIDRRTAVNETKILTLEAKCD
jgi:hypothetical protein